MKKVSHLPVPGAEASPRRAGSSAYGRFVAAQQDTLAVLTEVWELKLSVEQIASDGIAMPRAIGIKKAAHGLLGPTRSKKLQRINRELVVQRGYSLDALQMIFLELPSLHKNSDNPAHHPQAVLKEILETATGWVSDIHQHAINIVRDHNRVIEKEQEEKRQAALEKQQLNHNENDRQFDDHRSDSSEDDDVILEEPAPPDWPTNVEIPEEIEPPHGQVIFTRQTNAAGLRTFIIRVPEEEALAFEMYLEREAAKLMRRNPNLERTHARYLVLSKLYAAAQWSAASATPGAADNNDHSGSNISTPTEGSVEGEGAPTENTLVNEEPWVFNPTIIIEGGDYTEFKKDDPSEETLNASFGSDDGAIRSGADLGRQKMGPHRTFIHLDWKNRIAEVFVTRPHLAEDQSDAALEKTLTRIRAPLDLGTQARAPNALIRTIIDALYLQCVWPGCSTPGALSQYHHIVAAKNGGPTSVWNLTKLCPHHNGRNDDDRERQLNGYVFVDDAGVVKFQPPDNSEPLTASDPLSQLGALKLSTSTSLPGLQEVLEVPIPESCFPENEEEAQPENPADSTG